MNWLTHQSDLNFEPGEAFLYSNSGYWLLGQIVEKVSGKNMADYAREEIFEPLGMDNTHFHNDHTKIVRNRASGYVPSDDDTEFKISMTTLDMIGDGGIFTNIQDIKKWDDAYYHSDVLSKKFWAEMTQQGVLNNGEVIDYASGLVIGEYKGLKTIRHGGAFVGFRAELLRFPDQRLSIVIFANRGDARPSAMANQVADIMLKDSFTDTNEKTQDNIEENNSFIVLGAPELNKHTGSYWNETDYYSGKIYVKNDTLKYSKNSEHSESTLMPVSANEFKMIDVDADVLVQFDNNRPQSMTMVVNGGRPQVFTKYQPKVYTSEELTDFQGSYYSKELDVYYSLKQENGLLSLYINDRKKSPLKSVMNNLFQNDDYGTFRFINDQEGKLAGFRLAAGRVKNLKFEKQ